MFKLAPSLYMDLVSPFYLDITFGFSTSLQLELDVLVNTWHRSVGFCTLFRVVTVITSYPYLWKCLHHIAI